jgi:hypothetical protein
MQSHQQPSKFSNNCKLLPNRLSPDLLQTSPCQTNKFSNTCIRNSTTPTSIILEASTRAVSRPHLRPHFRIYLACTLSTSLPASLTQPTPHTQPNYTHTHAPLPFLQLLVGRIVGVCRGSGAEGRLVISRSLRGHDHGVVHQLV